MRIYCNLCDKVQPAQVDDCKDIKTGELYQDIVCGECGLVITSGTGIRRPWPKLMRGVRVEGDTVVITVKGGNEAARELCGALIEEMSK